LSRLEKRPVENGRPVAIEPVAFRTPPGGGSLRPARGLRWLATAVLAAMLFLLAVCIWFVFTARQVVIQIDPQPERVSIRGGPAAPKVGGHYLLRPGTYELHAEKKCFQPLDESFAVTSAKRQQLEFSMHRLPGRLSVRVHRAGRPEVLIEGARVFIDGLPAGVAPLQGLAVPAGRRIVEIRFAKYLVLRQRLQVQGCGQKQQLDLALVPGWSDITLESHPTGAAVRVDGKPVGRTPLTLELTAGDHDLELQAQGFKIWRTRLSVAANQARVLKPVELKPADGILKVQTRPPGAAVMVENSFAGKSPLTLSLAADRSHRIRLSKAGYENAARTVKLASGKVKAISIALKPKLGTINLALKPDDAEVFVDGKSRGRGLKRMRLVAVEHQLEIRKKGFQSYRTRIVPRPGFPRLVSVVLKRSRSGKEASASAITAVNGYPLKLIRPHAYTMGASRREQGRRSNETLRHIILKRPFYMGIREVTNRELRQFYAAHDAGAFGSQNLNADFLPAVRVTWNLAAAFCNWLSVKEGLTPVYVLAGTRLAAAGPVGSGYRLPTEAEWEYCARLQGQAGLLKYPWGDKFPPLPGAGNFGDQSAAGLLKIHLPDYNDGYAVTCPPKKFKANFLGLYDMGGNAAEWCHDYYSIYPYRPGRQYVDPLGPVKGKYHLVRGSSWQSASISTLRLAYRDYGSGRRPDVGFRICRYLKP